jgi:2-keto-4-pentenoate hydratase/2-oxohepta-3-ene-1,7-dioic acid hydratase in catechol pathway
MAGTYVCDNPKETAMDRRHFFETSAATVAAAGLSGCATPGASSTAMRTPFNVPATYIPVAGSDEVFPVRRIYCIGRNYRAHSIEMGSNPDREPPFFFQKPTDAIQFVAAGTVPATRTRR